MKVFVSLVSHGHGKLIQQLKVACKLSESNSVEIIIRDNVGEKCLEEFCHSANIAYERNHTALGFGENNNLNYQYFRKNFTTGKNDLFLVLNPDVVVSIDDILSVRQKMALGGARLGTCNLFLDDSFSSYDNSIRRFPRFFDFLKSYVLKSNPTIIEKSAITKPTFVDWAAGSFLLFSFEFYNALGGFDTGYFMYCEDIDICCRAQALGESGVLYVPEVRAIHLAKRDSRRILSKHFFWHLRSMFRYLIKNSGRV